MKEAPLLISVIIIGIIALAGMFSALTSSPQQSPTLAERQNAAYQAAQISYIKAQTRESQARADAISTDTQTTQWVLLAVGLLAFGATCAAPAAFTVLSVVVIGFLRNKPVERIIEKRVIYLDRPRREMWAEFERVEKIRVLKG